MRYIFILLAISILNVSCGQSDTTVSPKSDSTFNASQLPMILEAMAPINLSDKESGSELNLGRNLPFTCSSERNRNLGIFSMLWYYACVMSEASQNPLFGQVDPYSKVTSVEQDTTSKTVQETAPDRQVEEDTDEVANLTVETEDACSLVVAGDKTSFFAILCQLEGTQVIDKVLNVGSAEADSPFYVGVSFKELDGLPSSGSFSEGEIQFPLGARVWDGESESELAASYAVSMKNEVEGDIHIYYNFQDHGDQIQSKISYKSPTDEVDCAETLKREDCHSQNFSLYGGDDPTIQKGMSFTVLANNKENPDFVIVEGTWTLTEAQAKKLMGTNPASESDTLFESARKLYFRMIKKDRTLWAQFVLRDQNDVVIPGAGEGVGQSIILAEDAGHCMNFDEKVANPQTIGGLFDYYSCGETDFAELATAMTVGESEVEFIDSALPISELDFSR